MAIQPEADASHRARRGRRAVTVGLFANMLLAGLKTAIGIVGHSPALLADGINSTSDVAYYIVVSVFVRLAGKPADEEHPHGHSQLESVGALVVGSFVITTAVAIFWESVNHFYDVFTGESRYAGAASIALWVALFTILLKIILTIYTRRVGMQTNNASIIALEYDHRNDIFSAGAAAVGIGGGQFGYPWIDPLAGSLVALVILRTGIEILRQSTSDLMDTIPGQTLRRQIEEELTPNGRIKEIEEVHAYRFGQNFVVTLTIGVDGDLSVEEGDRIASWIERRLIENIEPVRRVHVHYHPAE